MEDREIVQLYWQRNEDAIAATREKYGIRLRKLSFDIVKNGETAEECEADTYLQAWNAIPPHAPWDYLYAFLARIVRQRSLNCCRDCSRLKRRAHILALSREMEQCIPAPDDTACRVDAMELKQALEQFLDTLSEEQRGMFLRRYWYMDSVADLAARFGCSQSKVKVVLHRCREKLRRTLKEKGWEL